MATERQGSIGPRREIRFESDSPFRILHDEEEGAVRGLAEVGHGDAVRMLEAASGFGFALETVGDVVEPAELGVQELDRQLLRTSWVLGAVDGPHAAATDPLHEAVAFADDHADSGSVDLFAARRAEAQVVRNLGRAGCAGPGHRNNRVYATLLDLSAALGGTSTLTSGGTPAAGRGGGGFGPNQRDHGLAWVEVMAGHPPHVVRSHRQDGGRIAAVFVPAEAVALVKGQRRGQGGPPLERDLVRTHEVALGALELVRGDGLAAQVPELTVDPVTGGPRFSGEHAM